MVTWLFVFAFRSALTLSQVRELSLLTGMRIRDTQNPRKDMPGSGRVAGNVGLQLERDDGPDQWRLRAFTHDPDGADLHAVERLRQHLAAFLPTIASDVRQLLAAPMLPPTPKEDPVPAARIRIQALLRQSRWQEAIAELTYARALLPADAQYVLRRAVCLKRLGRLEDALVDYGLAIALAPDEAAIYSARASLYTILGRFAEALADLCRTQALAPVDPNAWVKSGLIYYELNQNDASVHAFSRAITLAAHEADIYYFRGCAYYNLNQYDEALDDFRRAEHPAGALKEVPLADVLYNQVAALVRMERPERRRDAIAPLSRLLQLQGPDEELYLLRAAFSQSAGEYESAAADADRVLALNPTNQRAYNIKGAALGTLGQTGEAASAFSSAILLDPNNAVYRQNRALAWAKLGRLVEAEDDYRQAILLQPNNALLYSELGAVLVALGKFTEGLQRYIQALRLDHTHPATNERIASLVPVETNPALCAALERAIAGDNEATDRLAQAMDPGLPSSGADMRSDFHVQPREAPPERPLPAQKLAGDDSRDLPLVA